MVTGGLSYRVGNTQLQYAAPVLPEVTVLDAEGKAYPRPWVALVDTGSDRTIVPVEVPLRLDLIPTGYVSLSGFERPVAGALYAEYELCFTVPGLCDSAELAACAVGQKGHILLGRDFINQFVLTIDGPRARWRIARGGGWLRRIVRALFGRA